eukprot:5002389-Prymnesium_polylepis.2
MTDVRSCSRVLRWTWIITQLVMNGGLCDSMCAVSSDTAAVCAVSRDIAAVTSVACPMNLTMPAYAASPNVG